MPSSMRSSAELDDLARVVDWLDGPADVFGHSFGATVALAAAPTLRNLRRLVLYEPSRASTSVPAEDVARIEALVEAGERDEALVAAYGSFGLTPAEVARIRDSPVWPARVAAVHTIAREIRAEEGYAVEAGALRSTGRTGVAVARRGEPTIGGESAERIRAALPDARISVLPGQGHAAILTAS